MEQEIKPVNDEELLDLFTRGVSQVAPEKADMVKDVGLAGNLSDLALDSIETMELVAYVEEQIGTRFHDDDLAQLSSFAHLVELIRRAP